MRRRICPINKAREETEERTRALKPTWDVIWGNRLRTDIGNQHLVFAQTCRYFALNLISEESFPGSAARPFPLEGSGIIWKQQ